MHNQLLSRFLKISTHFYLKTFTTVWKVDHHPTTTPNPQISETTFDFSYRKNQASYKSYPSHLSSLIFHIWKIKPVLQVSELWVSRFELPGLEKLLNIAARLFWECWETIFQTEDIRIIKRIITIAISKTKIAQSLWLIVAINEWIIDSLMTWLMNWLIGYDNGSDRLSID